MGQSCTPYEEFFAGGGARPADKHPCSRSATRSSRSTPSRGPSRSGYPEAGAFRALIEAAGRGSDEVPLLESWRSTPEVLTFVDAVFADADAAAGLRPAAPLGAPPVAHLARREDGHGGVDFWPLEESEPDEDVDPWRRST